MPPSRLYCCLALFLGTLCMADTPRSTEEITRLALAGEAINGDFSGARAAGLAVSHCSLAASNWRNADLRGASLVAVSLEKADLRGANMRGAVLERVDLLNADLRGADLSGAVLCLTNLENAQLEGCRFDGAIFEGNAFSLTGAPYLVALHLALQHASGQQFSRPWLAGLSGDAFAFCYNTRDAGRWPGVPFNINPMTAAATNLGLQAAFSSDAVAEKTLFDKLQEKSVHVLALELSGEADAAKVDARLTQGGPVWGLVLGREDTETGPALKLFAPPFGERVVRRDQLMTGVWGGPWGTPEPAGIAFPARRQLVTIQRGVPLPAADQAALALAQAAAMITDKRTYGPLVPGESGLLRLASELRSASKSLDSDQAKQLLAWQRYPRHCLIGSLGMACDFLGEAAAVVPTEKQAACQEARMLLRSALRTLDTRWPPLSANAEALSPEQSAAFAQAADIVAEVAAAERKAAGLLGG